MSEFKAFFHKEDWQVTGFYPYTSCVAIRICKQDHNYKTKDHDFLEDLWKYFWEKAEALGCKDDNKIVLQITFPNKVMLYPPVLYIGKYDGQVSLGLSLHQDEWLKDRNKSFPLL